MRLYLDDDSAYPVLAQLLRNNGYDVQLPVDVGMTGKDDPVHLTHASSENRLVLTRNHGDFENLHNLIQTAQGHHPGILVVRQDNNPRRDMTHREIVRAIRNLLAANVPVADKCIVLNHWR